MKQHLFLTIITAIALLTPLQAQITTSENEPARVKWSTVSTNNYRLIYPRGLDSLARVYALSLESFYDAESLSATFHPNENYRRKMPVILHPYSTISNGMVSWTPRRMELYTCPEPYSALPQSWVTQLTVHESRHSSQMQLGRHSLFEPFHYLSGELFAGAMAGLYPGPHFLEGDAVVAETALTNSGRGRNADFLEFWRAEQADRERRDFWQWRYSSLRRYTPDYYRAGYVLIAGMRIVFDNPRFTSDYFNAVVDRKACRVPIQVLHKTVHATSGKKFNDAFSQILDTLDAQWARNDAVRSASCEFANLKPVLPESKQWSDIHGTVNLEGNLYAIRTSMSKPAELVKISTDGRISHLSYIGAGSGKLAASSPLSRLFWSELQSDRRYGMRSYSEIRYMASPGKIRTLRRKTRWFNPSPSPSDSTILVSEYAIDGSIDILRVDGTNGTILERYPAPAGLQVLETAFLGGDIVASATSEAGTGIYNVSGRWTPLLAPRTAQIKGLLNSADGQRIMFTSDRTGVKELYSLSADGSVRQMTSTRLGAQDFAFMGDTLYCSVMTSRQRGLYKLALTDLCNHETDYSQLCTWEMAEKLSAQEQNLGYKSVDGNSEAEISSPENYSKPGHLIKIHSWLPVYVDYDAIEDLSLQSVTSGVSPGASVFLQNELSTLSGIAGIKIFDNNYKFRTSFNADLSFTGWYPVIELKLSCNDRASTLYQPVIYTKDKQSWIGMSSSNEAGAHIGALLKTYIPLNYSSGAWHRGIIPQLSYSITNDMMRYQYKGLGWDETSQSYIPNGKDSWKTTPDSFPMSRLSMSLRGYTMLGTASNAIYPHLGIGAEAGFSGRIRLLDRFAPVSYLYAYGYLPGIAPNHGIRISWMHEKQLSQSVEEILGNERWNIPCFQEAYLNIIPRGYARIEGANSSVAYGFPSKDKFTLDYAFPFLPLDWSGLCPFAYVRNLECCLHHDLSLLHGRTPSASQMLSSSGIDLSVHLGNLAFLPYDTRIGISYCFNYGGENIFQGFQKHYVGMVFSVEM